MVIFYAKVQEGGIQMVTPWFLSLAFPQCLQCHCGKKLASFQLGRITMACLSNYIHLPLPHYLLQSLLLDSHNMVTPDYILSRFLLAWRSHLGSTMKSLGGNLRNCFVQISPRQHPSEPLGHRHHYLVLVLNSLQLRPRAALGTCQPHAAAFVCPGTSLGQMFYK